MNSTVTAVNRLLAAPTVSFPPTVIQNLLTINLNVAASSALLFWDVLLTIDREIQYIWKAKLSWISIIFGINRFLAVGGQILFLIFDLGTVSASESFCRGFVWFKGMFGAVMFVLADILLIARLFAFYGKNKTLALFLSILEILAFGGVVGLTASAIPKYKLMSNPDPSNLRVGTCISLGVPSIEPVIWIPLLAVQTVLFGFSIGRHVYLQRNNLLLATSDIYQIFIRDGVWAFFVLFFDLLLCVAGNALHKSVGPISVQWCYPVIGVCISRLILNLRHSVNDSEQSISYGSQSTTTAIGGWAFGAKKSPINSTGSYPLERM